MLSLLFLPNRISHLVVSVLHKAGRHMEDSITAAYISLLVGIIIQNSSVSSSAVETGKIREKVKLGIHRWRLLTVRGKH